MAAQVPQSFRNRPHPSNKPLHLHQIGLNFGVLLSMCSTSQDLVPCEVPANLRCGSYGEGGVIMINRKALLVFSMVVLLAACEQFGFLDPENPCPPIGQKCPEEKNICWYKYKISEVVDEQKGQFKAIYAKSTFTVTKDKYYEADAKHVKDKMLDTKEWLITLSPIPASGTVKKGHAYLFGNLCPNTTFELFKEIEETSET